MRTDQTTAEATGLRLYWLRTHYGMSQEAFAAQIGAQQSRYSNWESGKIRIPVEYGLRLNALYSTTLDFLYMGRLDGLPSHLFSAWTESPRVSASI